MARMTDPGEVGRRRRLNLFGPAKGAAAPAAGSGQGKPVQRAVPGSIPGSSSGSSARGGSAQDRPAASAASASPAASAPSSAPADNVDRSLRDRIRRLSAARDALRRRQHPDAGHGEVPVESDLDEAEAVAAARSAAASAAAPVAEEPVRRHPSDSDFRDTAAATEAAPGMRHGLDGSGRGEFSVGRGGTDVDAEGDGGAPAATGQSHPRQSAQRRGEGAAAAGTGTGTGSGTDLPATRRATEPDLAATAVKPKPETAGNADIAELLREVAALRREVSEVRREVRLMKESGPGNLGPIERAVQKLSGRLDRLDGGPQPAVEDRRESGPRHVGRHGKSGFFGLFRS